MNAQYRSFGSWAVRGFLLAVLVALGLAVGDRTEIITHAQQDTWTTDVARKVGVRLLQTRDASGPPAYPVAAGDLLFFTNVGTSFTATKSKNNSVVVINAKTKKPIAISDLEDEWSYEWQSHNVGVSPDAKYVYLPSLPGPATASHPGGLLVLDARTLKIYQFLTTPAGRPHHIKIYQDWTGKQRVLVEDFNWIGEGTMRSSQGTGFYVLDHTDDNKVIAGMTQAEMRGNPYAGFTSPDGRYVYFGAPGPQMPVAVNGLKGWLMKIDMQTWKVVQNIPMGKYPLWTAFTMDGRWAWTTNSSDDEVVKIQIATTPGQVDKVVAHAPTGSGPYAVRLSIDDKDVWVADKGEGKPTRPKSITIVDAETSQVKRTIPTDCVSNDHLILSPDGSEMWATCNGSAEIVVLDTKTYAIKNRIPMPNGGGTHGGSFVSYTQGSGGLVGETVSDLNGLHGSARAAALKKTPWIPSGSR